ncbi:MAG: hydantoinase/oxoprolinase family protein [Candidatus Dadabacteria bacterium]|nr:MAG: hydantoinase/oxoprolinase family protein [Candidatus Dadabacteria bacterium]
MRSKGASNGSANARQLAVGVDTGGTFTDLVYWDGTSYGVLKVPSTPDDPARAVIEAVESLFSGHPPEVVTYGTTVATNAMLERRGARTALVTTAGFEDVLEIGRQDRPVLYDLEPVRPDPLVPQSLRFGIRERTLYDGRIAVRPSRQELRTLAQRLAQARVESIGLCFLHAHANPANERDAAAVLKETGLPVSASHALCPEPGEYERSSTVAANAYVLPLVANHLDRLEHALSPARLRVMQSNGGAIGAHVAAREPIRTMLSGPAGGVVAALAVARRVGYERIITLDMGGTSTDVAFVDGRLPQRPDTLIGGLPIRTPCIDIHTVGAGGGSIAFVDEGGSLRVGPRSAGAHPGPACYGRGVEPTVTDANLVLGRLRPDAFLGGGMRLDTERARRVLAALARKMGVRSVESAAEGVVRVVEATMERALRVITVERGHDPRDCVLIAFGGAAGLHACGLAEALELPGVLVPPDPGLFSAWGVLASPVRRDRILAARAVNPPYSMLAQLAARASEAVRREVAAQGFSYRRIQIERWVKARYAGQAIAIEVPLTAAYRRRFHEEHARLLHTADPSRPVEVVGLRVTAIGSAPAPQTRFHAGRAAPPVRGRVFYGGRWLTARLLDRRTLAGRVDGPAVVTEYSSTVFLPPGWSARHDRHGNLLLSRRARGGTTLR